MASQAYVESPEQFRASDGDGGDEEDGDETLDPRVKGELDRLNSSTAEINRLEQDLEELQATFRQTLTESAYILKSQATFLGKCINQARPYYDAVRKAKQSQIETQKAALKYERTCSAHQAAKKRLAIAEQKLVSTSKEHKVLDPTWQEMLNQAVLKVMESDRERALSEREHLQTARAFSEAGSKVTELRTKLKSAISKSRPYFDLKMKYDQILEAHKKQVEITQEGLQEAKRKYSLALKNLEGISEEIHEMRRSRDSLDTILQEREEGVGAESPVGDLSCDDARPEMDFPYKDLSGGSALQNKPFYGLKIALVTASSGAQGDEVMGVDSGVPVGERDGDPEGCSALDEQQPDDTNKQQELTEFDIDIESDINQSENNSCDTIVSVESNSGKSLSPVSKIVISQMERTVENSISSLDDDQSTVLSNKEQEMIVEGPTDQQHAVDDKDSLSNALEKDRTLEQSCEAVTQSAYITDPLKQRESDSNVNDNDEDKTSRIDETHNACIQQDTVASETCTEQKNKNSIISETTPDDNSAESNSSLACGTQGENGQKTEILPSSEQES